MLIREMTMDDYPAAYELWTEIEGMGLGEADSREAIAAFLDRNPGHSFVCIIDQQLVGTVLCGHDGRRGFFVSRGGFQTLSQSGNRPATG